MALEQPKKPVGGAYGQFCAEKRPDFLKQCAGQRASEVSKLASAEWKKLTDAQKAPYEKKYLEAKAAFDTAMEAFLKAGGEKQKGPRALRTEKRKQKEGKKKAKDPNAPKKPAGGAYGIFMAEKRAEIMKRLPAGSGVAAIGKEGGRLWKELSLEAKKPYEAKFVKKMAEYKAAMEEYKKTHSGDAEEEGEEEEEEEEEAPATKRSRKAGA